MGGTLVAIYHRINGILLAFFSSSCYPSSSSFVYFSYVKGLNPGVISKGWV